MQKFDLKDPLHQRYLFAAIVIAFVFIFASIKLVNAPVKSTVGPKVDVSLPAFGLIPDLKTAMKKSSDLRTRVTTLLNYDEYYLFVNYREVNARVAEIMFLWSGLSLRDIKSRSGKQSIEHFLRQSHGLSDDRPVEGNPYLGENPWPRTFNSVKAKLLMLGYGSKIYTGKAFYNPKTDSIIVEGELSKKYLKEFDKFLSSKEDSKRFRNNFLAFVDDTKGLANLNQEERKRVRAL